MLTLYVYNALTLKLKIMNAKEWLKENKKKEVNLERSVQYLQWYLGKNGNDNTKMHFNNVIEHLNKYIYQKSDSNTIFSKLFLFMLVNQMSSNPYGGQRSWIKIITTILDIPTVEHIKNFVDAHNLNQYAFVLDLYGIEGTMLARSRKEMNEIQEFNKSEIEKNKQDIMKRFSEGKINIKEGESIVRTLLAEVISEYELKD